MSSNPKAKFEALNRELLGLKKDYDEVKKERNSLRKKVESFSEDNYEKIIANRKEDKKELSALVLEISKLKESMVPNALFLSSNEDPDSVFNKIKVEQNAQKSLLEQVIRESQESNKLVKSLCKIMKEKNIIPHDKPISTPLNYLRPIPIKGTISGHPSEMKFKEENVTPEDRSEASPDLIKEQMDSSNICDACSSVSDDDLLNAGNSASVASGATSPYPRVSPLVELEDNYAYLTNLDSHLDKLIKQLTRDEKLDAYAHVKGTDVGTVLAWMESSPLEIADIQHNL